LNNARFGHGCSRYTNIFGKEVNLVCGGADGSYVSSCEFNMAGTSNWAFMTPLPSGKAGLKGITIDNRVFHDGGDYGSTTYSTIYEMDLTTEEWEYVGDMDTARTLHAVSIVYTDLSQYCI